MKLSLDIINLWSFSNTYNLDKVQIHIVKIYGSSFIDIYINNSYSSIQIQKLLDKEIEISSLSPEIRKGIKLILKQLRYLNKHEKNSVI